MVISPVRSGLAPAPPALEGAIGAEALDDAVWAAVICDPDGATSHHLAPKLSLPWPLVWPEPESPAKKYSGWPL